MVRVLHMIPRHPALACAHQVDVLSTGQMKDIQLCNWPLNFPAARCRLLGYRISDRSAAPDVVHVWDWMGLRSALAATSSSPVLYSIQALESANDLRTFARLGRLVRRVAFVCSTALQKQMLERAGIAPAKCHAIEPGLATPSVHKDQRVQIRQSLGVSDEEILLLAPGDSNPTARHRLSLWATSILHVYDRRYRLLISGSGAQASSLQGLAKKLRQPRVLVSAFDRLGRRVDQNELVAAADVALATDSMAGSPLPMALCMKAGAPLIGDADGLAGQYALADPGAQLVHSLSAKLLARHIFEFFPIGTPHRDQVGNGRLAKVDRFDPVRFCRQMSGLYRLLSNR